VAVAAPTASATPEPAGVQLYVAPWGDDRGPGSIARPFATLTRAQQAVRTWTARPTGDIVVNLRGGWANPSSFIAAFTNIIGTTPGRHRASRLRPPA
jgi:hypothetical protein